jgi:hypothetical protein
MTAYCSTCQPIWRASAFDSRRRDYRFVACVAALIVYLLVPVRAQKPDGPLADEDQVSAHSGRLFGVLPNSETVEPGAPYGPITTREMFRFAADDSFDKAVYPFIGVVAYFGIGHSEPNYWKRYATSFADNVLGNYMVTAIFPMAFRQDPRYFVRGRGHFLARAGYAASRAVITRSRAGGQALNVSELGGNVAAATLSTLYYPAVDRTASSLLMRASSQVMWDALDFEASEFWPDIRRTLQNIFHRPRGGAK